jgi:hypothetical protein
MFGARVARYAALGKAGAGDVIPAPFPAGCQTKVSAVRVITEGVGPVKGRTSVCLTWWGGIEARLVPARDVGVGL